MNKEQAARQTPVGQGMVDIEPAATSQFFIPFSIFKIPFSPLLLHSLPLKVIKRKLSTHASEKKISRNRLACFFHFSSSIGICHCKSLAMVDTNYSFCDDIFCLGDGYHIAQHTHDKIHKENPFCIATTEGILYLRRC